MLAHTEKDISISDKKVDVKNTLKFLFGTLLGIVLVLVPFKFENGVDTVLFHYLKLFVSYSGQGLVLAITLLICLSAVLSLYDYVFKPEWIRNSTLMTNLFSTSPFYIINRFGGAAVAILCFWQFGPEFIISADTGSSMLGLAAQLSILVPSMLLLQTFILEFGAMEFIGGLIGFIVKPIFKVSEICAVSIISAWVGPGNAAILGTRDLFKQGYFTVKEAAIIGSQFSTSSIGWIVLVSSVLGLMDHFGLVFLTITGVGMIVAYISIRIPPISKYPDVYVDGSTTRTDTEISDEDKEHTGGKLQQALFMANERVETVTLKNFTSKINNMLFYVIWLTPIIVFWGAAALIISLYTPILGWISMPVEYILSIFNVSDTGATATAIMSGFADNYLPVILGEKITSIESRFIVGVMSILQLIFMSEIATLLTSTSVVKKFTHVIIIFLERTIISLPIVIIIAKIIF